MNDDVNDHELHLLTGAYAADALDADERALVEAHLAACPVCRQEVAELTATTARLGAEAAVPTPAALRDRVLAEADRTHQLPPLGGAAHPGRPPGRPWYRQPLAAAAAVLLVIAAGLGVLAAVESQRADEAQTMADRLAAVAADPARTVRTEALRDGGSGTVVAAHGIAVFHGSQLPMLPENRAYQLWRIRGQESTSAGVLGRGGELTGVVTDLAPGDAIGVTVEPAKGSERPTSDPVFLASTA